MRKTSKLSGEASNSRLILTRHIRRYFQHEDFVIGVTLHYPTSREVGSTLNHFLRTTMERISWMDCLYRLGKVLSLGFFPFFREGFDMTGNT